MQTVAAGFLCERCHTSGHIRNDGEDFFTTRGEVRVAVLTVVRGYVAEAIVQLGVVMNGFIQRIGALARSVVLDKIPRTLHSANICTVCS